MDEIAPGVFVATAEIYTTTTTVVAGADGGCLVIDPAVTPADLARLAAWLSSRGLRPAAGWSTHPHWDHVLWSWPLGDAVRYATPRAVEAAARKLPGLVSEMEESAPGHDLSLFARLAPLAGSEIPWAGPRATVVAHDAHAPGHGAVFLPDSGVLVAGDMCSDIEIPLLDGESADPFGDTGTGSARWRRCPASASWCRVTATSGTGGLPAAGSGRLRLPRRGRGGPGARRPARRGVVARRARPSARARY